MRIGGIKVAETFLQYWFEGFERSIQNLDGESREEFFRECGKSCSDSYTRQVYVDEYKASRNIDEFLSKLKNRFPEIGFRVIIENKIIELTYEFCACELVKNGYIRTPLLCECSRQSLLNNWGCVFGPEKVSVQLNQSILAGDSCCKFTIVLT